MSLRWSSGCPRLLRRHVSVFALEDADRGLVHDRRSFGDPEVGDLYFAHERDEDVVRADVAMNDVEERARRVGFGMGVVEALAYFATDVDRDLRLHLASGELRGTDDI